MVLTLIYMYTFVRLRHLVSLPHFADVDDDPGNHDGSTPNGLCLDYRGLLENLFHIIDAAMIMFENYIQLGLCLGSRSCSAEKILILMGGGMPIVLHISFTIGGGAQFDGGDVGLLALCGTLL